MDFPAAPRPGRRVTFGAVAVLAAVLLLAPPLFVLAPFVLLGLLSPPRSARELFALVAAAGGVFLALSAPAGVAVTLIRVAGLTFALFFVVQSLRGDRTVLSRGLLALLLTALAIMIWLWSRGIGWAAVQQAFTAWWLDNYRAMIDLAKDDPGSQKDLEKLLEPLLNAIPNLVRAMPGALALQALAGGAVAWSWHHRIATTPVGSKPIPLSGFRFNDRLIWGAIFSLALFLAPLPDSARTVALNLVVLMAGIYALRGLAVVAAVFASAPGPLRFMTALVAVLLTPLALGAFLALGLADTWFDVRARLAPTAPGGP